MSKEKILSVFIDESGDFGPYDIHSPYYIVAMVLHDQSIDLSHEIDTFEKHMSSIGYPNHAIHTGPLIRREQVYENDLIENRKHLFDALYYFTRKVDIHYTCAEVKKSECNDEIELATKLVKQIAGILKDNSAFWNSFDKIIVYYDNGQVELTKILTSVFNTLFSHVEFRRVEPVDYKLFQVADLVCTTELLSKKYEAGTLSKSEIQFFGNARSLKKDYLKKMSLKHL